MATSVIGEEGLLWHFQADGIRVYTIAPPNPLPLGPGPFPDERQDYDPDA